jgi:hypothetical protein
LSLQLSLRKKLRGKKTPMWQRIKRKKKMEKKEELMSFTQTGKMTKMTVK